jgi:hypothetical protein
MLYHESDKCLPQRSPRSPDSPVLVTPNELSDALCDGYSDADVDSYIKRQLAAAGYVVHNRPHGTDKAAWSLTFLG